MAVPCIIYRSRIVERIAGIFEFTHIKRAPSGFCYAVTYVVDGMSVRIDVARVEEVWDA